MKEHTTKYLIDKLRKRQIILAKTYAGAQQVLHYWIRTGKIILRQRPHNGYYIVTENEVSAILKEFGEGGTGYWSYK